jgi:Fe-S cluster assembly protein SufB
MDTAVHAYPELVQKYFMADCVPADDHIFTAMHGAVWSGGTFIYIPKGVKVSMPLQAYFRMNEPSAGQFEHTLIIVDEGASVEYIEGCSAPKYNASSLHAGCVEIFVHKNAEAKYISVENWSKNTYNLNTKKSIVHENGNIKWVNGNMGSKVTMLYPTSVLIGDNSKSESLGVVFAGEGQHQDTGSKVIHIGKNTSSVIKSKSVSMGGGVSNYRGFVQVTKNAVNTKSHVSCDALILDGKSVSNTWPMNKIENKNADVSHEATVGKIGDKELFYLMSHGFSKDDAYRLVVGGFVSDIIRTLPLEYAIEFNRLVELEMG